MERKFGATATARPPSVFRAFPAGAGRPGWRRKALMSSSPRYRSWSSNSDDEDQYNEGMEKFVPVVAAALGLDADSDTPASGRTKADAVLLY